MRIKVEVARTLSVLDAGLRCKHKCTVTGNRGRFCDG